MALIYQPSKRIFCGWFEPLKSTTYSEYPGLPCCVYDDCKFFAHVGLGGKFDVEERLMLVCLRLRSHAGGSVLDWMSMPITELGHWNRVVQQDLKERESRQKG